MTRLARSALLGAAVASFLAAPAQAATNCFGPQTMFLCVTTPEPVVGSRTECVYLGGTTCQNVTIPTVGTTGRLDWSCGGAWTCLSPGR